MKGQEAPLRALFLNEGALAAGPIGHPRVEASIRAGLEAAHLPVDAHYCSLPPMGSLAAAAVRGVPGLRAVDLDLQQFRWHAVQAMRVQRLLRRELQRRPVDVVHVVSHAIALGMAGQMRRLPTALSVDVPIRGVREMQLWRPLRAHSGVMLRPSLALERRALAAATLVLPWSEWAKRGVERACPTARAVKHSPGLDLETFHPAPRRERQRSRVLFVGGRFEDKGGADLIRAMEPLLGHVELDLVTQEPPPPRAGVRVHSLEPGDPRLVDLYQQADLFCLPSRGDAFPWAVLEAMAAGAPVVASSVGAIPEMLDQGRAGVLVPPGDVSALRGALQSLLGDAGRRRELAVAARTECERKHDARRQTVELIDLLLGCVAAWRLRG